MCLDWSSLVFICLDLCLFVLNFSVRLFICLIRRCLSLYVFICRCLSFVRLGFICLSLFVSICLDLTLTLFVFFVFWAPGCQVQGRCVAQQQRFGVTGTGLRQKGLALCEKP